jgi:aspartyl-tRNA(Asn)/glutamyl-tRNA(Gln) amidotransferase subunit A
MKGSAVSDDSPIAWTLTRLADELARGRASSREHVEACLARATSPSGEGQRTFLKMAAEPARAAADYVDKLRKLGASPGRFAGIPLSVKDLFDVAGEVTTAGSVVLQDADPATHDAVTVARLRAAGFIILGRTNMTEFAFSGLGINPHYDTPRNPWDRAADRIPGGSSSGAAISVTDGMAFGALGTDTGGSCRIPAALCGIVGFKPTARRVPLTGAYPLSPTLDSIGTLANSVSCCAMMDAVLAGEPPEELIPANLVGLRLGVPRSYVSDGLAAEVASSFERALHTLSKAGAHIQELPFAELTELPGINAKAGFPAPEAYALHRARIALNASGYDPRVLSRILRGREQDAADYIELHRRRQNFIRRVTPIVRAYDAMLMPTVPMVAPRVADLAADEAYTRVNALALRNSTIVNFIDGCGISIPCHEPGAAPVGLTLFGPSQTDRRLLEIAAAAEICLKRA